MCHSCSGDVFLRDCSVFRRQFASHCLNVLVDIVAKFKREFSDVAPAAVSSLFAS